MIWTHATAMIDTRHECQCCGRVARITGEYDDKCGETGFAYKFKGEQYTRYISARDAALKFRRIGDDADAVRTKLRESIDEGR